MKPTNILLTILLAVLATSCYHEIDLDKYREDEGENLLTLNSIIDPDNVIAVAATRTWYYTDQHLKRDYIPDLDIRIVVNGEDCGLLTYNPDTKLYEYTAKPAEGDVVQFFTTYKGRDVSCSTTVPRAVPIESIEQTWQHPVHYYTDRDFVGTYRITFTDPPGENNYYFLRWEAGDWYSFGEMNYTYEYVFQQLAQQINASVPGWEPYSPWGLPFSDYGIDGKTHTLVVKEIIQPMWNPDYINSCDYDFKLFSISEDYYKYLVSVLSVDPDGGLYGGMIDLGLAAPTKIFSNITGGVGILASYSKDVYTMHINLYKKE